MLRRTWESQSRVVALSAALALGVLVTGCKGKDASAVDTTAGAMSSTAGDTSAMASAAAGSTAATPAPLSDANIAALLNEANAGDSTLAAAALPHLTSTGAKNFAKLMMGEHHALLVQGMQVQKAQNITPVLPAVDPFKPAVEGEQSALASATKGMAYDSTYIANEVGIHQAVIDWAGKNTPQNAALQAYMKSAGPTLVKHLDAAQALQKKMEGAKK